MPGSGQILAIESSCDETAAAVVERGSRTLSSVVASQIATHARYGGVVPELASREHLRSIVPVVRLALERSATRLDDLEAIAAGRYHLRQGARAGPPSAPDRGQSYRRPHSCRRQSESSRVARAGPGGQ